MILKAVKLIIVIPYLHIISWYIGFNNWLEELFPSWTEKRRREICRKINLYKEYIKFKSWLERESVVYWADIEKQVDNGTMSPMGKHYQKLPEDLRFKNRGLECPRCGSWGHEDFGDNLFCDFCVETIEKKYE